MFEELESDFYRFVIYHVLYYIIIADSQEYFALAKERFSRIDEKFVPKNNVKFDLVLNIDDYLEFKFEYLKILYEETSNKLNKDIVKLTKENDKIKKKNKKLEKNNEKLKKQNKKLKKENKSLLNSKSWKLTEPLRKFKKNI